MIIDLNTEDPAYEYLLDLEEQHTGLTPGIVLEAARSVSSPLHSRFEWDDAKAAEAHRLDQAGNLIRSFKIVVLKDSKDSLRAFTYVPSKQRYHSTKKVAADESIAQEVLGNIAADVFAMVQRYRAFASLVPEAGEMLVHLEETPHLKAVS